MQACPCRGHGIAASSGIASNCIEVMSTVGLGDINMNLSNERALLCVIMPRPKSAQSLEILWAQSLGAVL